jgi:Ni/Co efflux regulator RcnB
MRRIVRPEWLLYATSLLVGLGIVYWVKAPGELRRVGQRVMDSAMSSVPAKRMPTVLASPSTPVDNQAVTSDLVYRWQKGDSLSQVLFRIGVGVKGSPWNLYGANGYVARNKALNSTVQDWDRVSIGTPIKLEIPAALRSSAMEAISRGTVRPAVKQSDTSVPATPTRKVSVVRDGRRDFTETTVVRYKAYTWKKGDTLSEVLHRHGVGSKTSRYRLYGSGGWLSVNTSENPAVSAWDKVPPGAKVQLVIPLGERTARGDGLKTQPDRASRAPAHVVPDRASRTGPPGHRTLVFAPYPVNARQTGM